MYTPRCIQIYTYTHKLVGLYFCWANFKQLTHNTYNATTINKT